MCCPLPDRPVVLVVEDETLIGMGIEQTLRELGCAVLGPAASVQRAMHLLGEARPDAALLDLRPGPHADSRPVAEALAARGVPFAVLTGMEVEDLPAAYRDRLCLPKPFTEGELRATVRDLLSLAMAGAG